MKNLITALALVAFMGGTVFAQEATLPIKKPLTSTQPKSKSPGKSGKIRSSKASRKTVKRTLAAKASSKPHGKKRFEDMTATEVARNPAVYGFKQGGGMVTTPVNGSSLESSRDEQWTKEANGRLYILTIHYDKNGKMVYAKWGGF